MWKDHFQRLYNSVSCDTDAAVFKNVLSGIDTDSKLSFCLAEVVTAIHKQKLGKAPDADGIHGEAYIHGGLRLATHNYVHSIQSISCTLLFTRYSFMD